MTYVEAMEFWFSRVNYEVRTPSPSDLSLDRMRALMQRLGDPQDRSRIIHIAGTKGKGSTSAMLASILGRAGYRTGLFTSPHLVRVEERIQVDGEPIGPEELASLMGEIQLAARTRDLERDLTFFEIATALGFLHFARRRVGLGIVEVGLGGRFDSTNICKPLLAIITSISFDHVKQLGNTLEKIAGEKAGIVKAGRPTLSGVRSEEARAVIAGVCRERGSPLRQVDVDYRYQHLPARIGPPCDFPMRVEVTTGRGKWPWLEVDLIGEHQAANAAVAVAAIEILRGLGLAIPQRAVSEGLSQVRWPARLEILGRQPLVVVDCAHNVASAQALVDALQTSFPLPGGAKRLLVFAGSRDKDLAGMLQLLAPLFDRIYFSPFAGSSRGVDPGTLIAMLPSTYRGCAVACTSPTEAWSLARSAAGSADLICVAGSVFLAGDLRPVILK